MERLWQGKDAVVSLGDVSSGPVAPIRRLGLLGEMPAEVWEKEDGAMRTYGDAVPKGPKGCRA